MPKLHVLTLGPNSNWPPLVFTSKKVAKAHKDVSSLSYRRWKVSLQDCEYMVSPVYIVTWDDAYEPPKAYDTLPAAIRALSVGPVTFQINPTDPDSWQALNEDGECFATIWQATDFD